MKRRWIFGVVGLVGLVGLGLVGLEVRVCWDRAFIDMSSGSRKGYREWIGGGRSGWWYQESGVEAYMRKKHAGELRQEWVSYAGTELNIYGGNIGHSHGHPGAIMGMSARLMEEYCKQASEAEKRHIYEVLASRDREQIMRLVDQMCERVFNEREVKN